MGCFSGSSQKSSGTSKTRTQTGAIDKGVETYSPYLGKGMDVYGGQRVAPLTGAQQNVFGQLPEFANYFGDYAGGGPLQKDLETTSGKLLRGEMGAQPITPEDEQAYFGRAVRDPRMKEFQQEELPGIREEFAGPGYWGSARAGEVAEAYGDVGDWLGTERAGLAWDVQGRNQALEEAKAGRALGAIGPSMAVQDAPLGRTRDALAGMAGTLGLAGAEQDQYQREIAADMQVFAEKHAITDPQVLNALAMLLGQSVNVSQSSSAGPGLGYALATG